MDYCHLKAAYCAFHVSLGEGTEHQMFHTASRPRSAEQWRRATRQPPKDSTFSPPYRPLLGFRVLGFGFKL